MACGTPVFTECAMTAPAGKRDLLVEREVARVAHGEADIGPVAFRADHAGRGLEADSARACPVIRLAKRAKQRAPLPHISASPPSAL